MASDPDDNPFARSSAWPKMPQAPFRVGPMPKADAAPPEPPPRTVTPVFTRPTGPAAFTGLTSGGAVPRRPASPAPATPAPPPPEPTPVEAPPPAAPAEMASEPFVEMAPVNVQPLGSGRRMAAVRKSQAPAIAAIVVGLAGVLGLAYLFNRGQEEGLRLKPAAPPAVVASAPVSPRAATPEPAVSATPAPEVAPTPARTRVVAASRTPARTAAPRRVELPAQEPAAAPVIALPPPVVAGPEPQPTYSPPAAPDPNAPMTTRRPD